MNYARPYKRIWPSSQSFKKGSLKKSEAEPSRRKKEETVLPNKRQTQTWFSLETTHSSTRKKWNKPHTCLSDVTPHRTLSSQGKKEHRKKSVDNAAPKINRPSSSAYLASTSAICKILLLSSPTRSETLHRTGKPKKSCVEWIWNFDWEPRSGETCQY